MGDIRRHDQHQARRKPMPHTSDRELRLSLKRYDQRIVGCLVLAQGLPRIEGEKSHASPFSVQDGPADDACFLVIKK